MAQAQPLAPDLHLPKLASDVEAQLDIASQWKLMWWKFRRHRLALASAVVVILIYLVAIFVDFLAPFNPETTNVQYTYAPPTPLRFIDGQLYTLGYKSTIDPVALRRTFVVDESIKYPVGLF